MAFLTTLAEAVLTLIGVRFFYRVVRCGDWHQRAAEHPVERAARIDRISRRRPA